MKPLLRAKSADILESLNNSPVVFLNGPRQAGKSTLARWLAKEHLNASYVTLDDAFTLEAALSDPESFLQGFTGSVVIDEVQLAPNLFRAIKIVVDNLRYLNTKHANGKFLLTGSANVLAVPQLSDALVGRMQIHTLLPLSAGEIIGKKDNFISSIFNYELGHEENPYPSFSINDIISKATFPEIFVSPKNSSQWYENYLMTIIQRDVRNINEIEKIGSMITMIKLLAARAGTLVNDSTIAQESLLNAVTYSRYKALILLVFLIFLVPSWYNNRAKRLVKSSKLFFTDTALVCHLLKINMDSLKEKDPSLFGHILENFVASELNKQLSWNPDYQLHHWRTHDKKEVDFVIEQRDGQIAGIEVKSKRSLTGADFKHLKTLLEISKDKFSCGIVLYLGKDIVQFDKKLYAMPISALWNLGATDIV